MVDDTLAPSLRSWVESAADPSTDFPIQNLPFGVFRPRSSGESWRVGTAIGAHVLDLAEVARSGLLSGSAGRIGARCDAPSLNAIMESGITARRELRAQVSQLLRADTEQGARAARLSHAILLEQSAVEMRVPAAVGDYTDFYASLHHATNVGSMFRPDNPLLPNYKWLPVGYHGRASSIVVSGTPIRRPFGQVSANPAGPPAFAATGRLDYEAEVAWFVGTGNSLGVPIAIGDAESHLFGAALLNDWSARDVQAWEYQPLGPFLAKNFATTVSPWVVTLDALAPFRAPAARRGPDDPRPLPYLTSAEHDAAGGFAVTVEVWLRSAEMRTRQLQPVCVSRSSLTDMFWTPAQLVTHHASNGCNLTPGDVLGSGTISGAEKGSRGCLLELTWRGTEPLTLPTGEERRFLADGDEVTLRGYCEAEGAVRIGFGDCTGVVLPAEG
jgi:fumarylacetoacetase